MGLCVSTEQKRQLRDEGVRSHEIDLQNARAHAQTQSVKKLLLLGAGESGKSTLLKGVISIYGKGYSEEDRRAFLMAVYSNTISAMQALIEQVRVFAEEEEDDEEEGDSKRYEISNAAKEAAESIERIPFSPDVKIGPEEAKDIETLWQDAAVQQTFARRSEFQLGDSAQYFFERVHEIAKPSFVPSEQDLLRVRVRTTGIVESNFCIEGNNFTLVDVGGQRNERKKWIHAFEGCTGVIFVAAISEYDQKLFEDDITNRLDEALALFEEICNSRWFRDTSVILFLNKRDLFEEKIERVPLTVWRPDYSGPNTYDAGIEYLTREFEARNRTTNKVYTHVTCATNKDNVSHVFFAVKDIILRRALRDANLLH
ncbi:MAG: hypothetical protein MHM6MM_005450 [Cercozoa sp. M6MM]